MRPCCSSSGSAIPVPRYAGNRHNVGFMVVEAIAKRHSIAPWRRRFQGVATEGPIGGERVLLLLPGTFMNESGRAVAEAAHFYKLEPAARSWCSTTRSISRPPRCG